MLKIRFAAGGYDRLDALKYGLIKPEGIELEFIEINEPRRIFDGMLGDELFDVSEFSSSEFITRTLNGNFPFVGIPIFPSKAFRHGFIFINKTSGITNPKDLEGRVIGVPQHSQTAAVWIRGHLQHDYGVDWSTVKWIEGSIEQTGTHAKIETTSPSISPTIVPNNSGKSISDLLADGEIDGIIGSRRPDSMGKNPNVKRLFSNYRSVEREYFKRTGIHPIMHVIVIRQDIYEQNKWIAESLYNAFEESKDWALKKLQISAAQHCMLPFMFSDMDEVNELFEGDPWPYGIEANRPTLEALLEHLHEQHFITEAVPIEQLFISI